MAKVGSGLPFLCLMILVFNSKTEEKKKEKKKKKKKKRRRKWLFPFLRMKVGPGKQEILNSSINTI